MAKSTPPRQRAGTARTRQERTRDKIAAQRAAQARQDARRKMLLSAGAVVVVIAVIAVLVGLGLNHKAGPTTGAKVASDALVSQVENVPASVLNAAPVQSGIFNPPQMIKGPTQLTSGGKPEIVYVGAEYCPHCAAERWAMVNALSRFGKFTNLHTIRSATADGDVPTFSFYGSTYTSKYISFSSTEQYSNQPQGSFYTPLQSLSSRDTTLLSKYDAPPYISSANAGAIPFIDFANRYVQNGTQFNDSTIASTGSSLTWQGIAADMHNPKNQIGQQIDASANVITAEICKVLGGGPSSVCQAPGVTAALAKLPTSPPK